MSDGGDCASEEDDRNKGEEKPREQSVPPELKFNRQQEDTEEYVKNSNQGMVSRENPVPQPLLGVELLVMGHSGHESGGMGSADGTAELDGGKDAHGSGEDPHIAEEDKPRKERLSLEEFYEKSHKNRKKHVSALGENPVLQPKLHVAGLVAKSGGGHRLRRRRGHRGIPEGWEGASEGGSTSHGSSKVGDGACAHIAEEDEPREKQLSMKELHEKAHKDCKKKLAAWREIPVLQPTLHDSGLVAGSCGGHRRRRCRCSRNISEGRESASKGGNTSSGSSKVEEYDVLLEVSYKKQQEDFVKQATASGRKPVSQPKLHVEELPVMEGSDRHCKRSIPDLRSAKGVGCTSSGSGEVDAEEGDSSPEEYELCQELVSVEEYFEKLRKMFSKMFSEQVTVSGEKHVRQPKLHGEALLAIEGSGRRRKRSRNLTEGLGNANRDGDEEAHSAEERPEDQCALLEASEENSGVFFNVSEVSKVTEMLVANLLKFGFRSYPTLKKVDVPIMLNGHDLMSFAQTKYEKTATFIVPIMITLLVSKQDKNVSDCAIRPRAVVMTHTSESVIRMLSDAHKFTCGTGLKVRMAYGGTSDFHQTYQVTKLSEGCDILLTTPESLNGLIRQNLIDFSSVKVVVLDNADRMYNLGSLPEIESALQHETMPQPGQKQFAMFGATNSFELESFAYRYSRNCQLLDEEDII